MKKNLVKESYTIKLPMDIPSEIINYLHAYKPSEKSMNEFLNIYLSIYLDDSKKFNLLEEDIFSYEKLGKEYNNFSFYVKESTKIELEKMAIASLRTIKAQSTHFIYSLYKSLKSGKKVYDINSKVKTLIID